MRVWICANKAIARAGMESIIRQATFEIAGSSSNLEALFEFEGVQPDVILLEWLEGDEEFFGELLFDRETVNPAIVVLSDRYRDERIVDLLSMGVRGILPRSATAEEIVSAVAAAAAGLIVLHPDFADWLSVPSFRTQVLPAETTEALTQREIEVLQMLSQGLGNKAIASRLNISDHTVKFHISSIFTKLNASSRTEAVMLGLRQGFIML